MTKYRIYQMRFDDLKEKRIGVSVFMDSYFNKEYRSYDSKDYDLVYDSALPNNAKSTNEDEDIQNLEVLFHMFNINHPSDYVGRSMSPSDIVELYNDEQSRFYCCKSMGWAKAFFNKN